MKQQEKRSGRFTFSSCQLDTVIKETEIHVLFFHLFLVILYEVLAIILIFLFTTALLASFFKVDVNLYIG